jgi:hypothetical protein
MTLAMQKEEEIDVHRRRRHGLLQTRLQATSPKSSMKAIYCNILEGHTYTGGRFNIVYCSRIANTAEGKRTCSDSMR